MVKNMLHHLDRSFVPPPFDGFTVSVLNIMPRKPGYHAGNSCLDPLALRLHFSMDMPFLCVFLGSAIIIANDGIESHLQKCKACIFVI